MKLARYTALVLLAFLAITSVVGAVPMLGDPHGQPWQMPQSVLQHSPFHSFLIPGLILLGMNGLLCAYVFFLALMRRSGYGLWIAAQGCILLGWLVVECVMIRMVIWPHYVYGAVALLLIATGFILRSDTKPGNRFDRVK